MIKQAKQNFKVGQRVSYLPDTGKQFRGTIEAIAGHRVLVRWDEYEDSALDIHSKSDLAIIPQSFGIN